VHFYSRCLNSRHLWKNGKIHQVMSLAVIICDGGEVTSDGKSFHVRAPATGRARRPTVESLTAGASGLSQVEECTGVFVEMGCRREGTELSKVHVGYCSNIFIGGPGTIMEANEAAASGPAAPPGARGEGSKEWISMTSLTFFAKSKACKAVF